MPTEPIQSDKFGDYDIDTRTIYYKRHDDTDAVVMQLRASGSTDSEGNRSGEVTLDVVIRDSDNAKAKDIQDAVKAFLTAINKIAIANPKRK